MGSRQAAAMRLLLLALLLTPLAAQEAERFVLTDGRVLIGTYDAERRVVQISGPIRAGIRVDPAAIQERRPATADELPVVEPPADPAVTRANTIAWLRTLIRDRDRTLEDHEREVVRLTSAREAAVSTIDALAIQITDRQAALTAQEAAITEVQRQIDAIEQQRAISEIRLRAVTLESGDLRNQLTVTEITTELTAAQRRIDDLNETRRRQVGIADGHRQTLHQLRRSLADQRTVIADIDRRIDRFQVADAAGRAERARWADRLASLESAVGN